MKIIKSLFITLSLGLAAIAQSGGPFVIQRSVIASGGGASSGGAFGVKSTIGQPFAGTESLGGNIRLISGFWSGGSVPLATSDAPFDFDGDDKTDIAIFRPSAAEWWINRSSNGSTFAAQFGLTNDRITPADFTGDGKCDIAF